MTLTSIRETLHELVAPARDLAGVLIAIYVYGSFAKGTARNSSDIDLAFVFNEKFYKDDPFRALQRAELLSAEVSKRMRRAIDTVVLNGCSLSFTYHAVREGACVYEKNSAGRILYEVVLDNKYQDFMPFIEELRDKKRRALIGRD
ncbi:MAG: nucleotidyltransferase domain-containing protein [Nitrospirae bacterium]|nr:nucleotidyltransferase domain-containing protein [Nitrospirota bacterium]MCL5237903.1 nucleotidyltransferase domain-containing protein [Nitrospirota bacterium]